MKCRFVILFIALFSFMSNAENLKVKDMNAYGSRFIQVSGETFALNNKNGAPATDKNMHGFINYSLTMDYDLKKPTVKTYKLMLVYDINGTYGDLSITHDARMLLKLNNGTTMTLKSNDTESLKPGGVYGYTLYTIYKITPTQINQIIKSGGISKIRVEFASEPIDFAIYDNSLYTFIKEANTLIKDTLNKKDSFDKDF